MRYVGVKDAGAVSAANECSEVKLWVGVLSFDAASADLELGRCQLWPGMLRQPHPKSFLGIIRGNPHFKD